MSAQTINASPLRSFEYRRPQTLHAAFELLTEPDAVPLAGGTDLVLLRAAGTVRPKLVVDLKRIPELGGFAHSRTNASIGAAMTMQQIVQQLRGRGIEALADAAAVVGGRQTRARATVGGNVCRSSPAGDTLPALLVLDAVCELISPEGARSVPLREFLTGPGTNKLRYGELLSRLELRQTVGSAYCRYTYRAWLDLAVVGVAARIEIGTDGRCAAAGIALGAAAPTPVLVDAAEDVLVGSRCDDATIAEACAAVIDAARPIDDVRGTADFRVNVLPMLTRDVIRRALTRARQGSS